MENSLARGATGIAVQSAWQRHVTLFVVKEKCIFHFIFVFVFFRFKQFSLLLLSLRHGSGVRNVMIVSMCQSCPHAYLQNHVTDLHQFFVHAASDHGTVIYCNMFCTFGFVDDGTSSSSSRKGAISVAEHCEQCRIARFPIMDHVKHFNVVAESDVYDCLVLNCSNCHPLVLTAVVSMGSIMYNFCIQIPSIPYSLTNSLCFHAFFLQQLTPKERKPITFYSKTVVTLPGQ